MWFSDTFFKIFIFFSSLYNELKVFSLQKLNVLNICKQFKAEKQKCLKFEIFQQKNSYFFQFANSPWFCSYNTDLALNNDVVLTQEQKNLIFSQFEDNFFQAKLRSSQCTVESGHNDLPLLPCSRHLAIFLFTKLC